MSDFGALLVVQSGFVIQDDEKELIRNQLEELLNEEIEAGVYKYENALGEKFKSTLLELDKKSIAFQLSEYWYGDEDEDEDDDENEEEGSESFEFAREEDEETAKSLVTAMKSALPKYQFTLEFDEW